MPARRCLSAVSEMTASCHRVPGYRCLSAVSEMTASCHRVLCTTKSLLLEAAHGRGVIAVDGDRADPRWSCRHHDMLAALRREVEPFAGRSSCGDAGTRRTDVL